MCPFVRRARSGVGSGELLSSRELLCFRFPVFRVLRYSDFVIRERESGIFMVQIATTQTGMIIDLRLIRGLKSYSRYLTGLLLVKQVNSKED